jgi:hypothetical protein
MKLALKVVTQNFEQSIPGYRCYSFFSKGLAVLLFLLVPTVSIIYIYIYFMFLRYLGDIWRNLRFPLILIINFYYVINKLIILVSNPC